MADDTLYVDLSKLSGINTVDAETDLQPERTDDGGYLVPLRAANNVIITNKFKPETRIGYDRILSGNSTHSLWSNGSVCLFVEGDTLYLLNEDYSITALREGLMVGARMTYKQWGNRVYYSNKFQIGWIAIGKVDDIREDGSVVERSDEVYSDHDIRQVDSEESPGTTVSKTVIYKSEPANLTISAQGQSLKGIVYDAMQAVIAMSGFGSYETTVAPSAGITLDSVAQDSGDSYNWIHTVGSGSNKLLLVIIAGVIGSTIADVQADSTSLTKWISATGEGLRTEAWYLINPPEGNLLMTVTGSFSQTPITSISLFGVDQTDPLYAGGVGSGYDELLAHASISGYNANDWLIDTLNISDGTCMPNAGQTVQMVDDWGMANLYLATKLGTTPEELSWNISTGLAWLEVIVPVKAA